MLVIVHAPVSLVQANGTKRIIATAAEDALPVMVAHSGTIVFDASDASRELPNAARLVPDFFAKWHVLISSQLTPAMLHTTRYLASSGMKFDTLLTASDQEGRLNPPLTNTSFVGPSILLKELAAANLDDRSHDLIAMMILAGRHGLRVGVTAALSGTSKRTLLFQFRKSGLASPGTVRDWILAMYTVYLREMHSASVKQMMGALQISSSSELRRIARRTIGPGPTAHANFRRVLERGLDAIRNRTQALISTGYATFDDTQSVYRG